MKRYVIALLALTALLASCTRGSVGIFASIEQEVKTQKSNLSENSPISGVAESENHYFASVGNIARRPTDGGEWGGVGDPPGIDSPISVALVQLGAPGDREYYAAYNSQEGSDNGFFRLTIDDSGDVEFTELSLQYDKSVNEIAALVAVDTDLDGFGDRLFASVRSGSSNDEPLFSLLENPANVGGNEETLIEGSDNLFDGAVDNGGDIWFVGQKGGVFRYDTSGSSVDRLRNPTDDPIYPHTEEVAEGGFSGVYSIDRGDLPGGGTAGTTVLFVSDSDGRLWATDDDGTSWDMKDLSNRAFTDMIWMPSAGPGGEGALLVGTKPVVQQGLSDEGYFEVDLSASDGEVSFGDLRAPDASSYDASELQNASVRGFYRPNDGGNPSEDQVFVLTEGIGLWRVIYDENGTPDVRWE
ncbi:MAG: hypothetical protein ACLFQZ_02010 [Spirochaetaceae bacterium]